MSQYRLILFFSLFLTIFLNLSFFNGILKIFPFNLNFIYILSIFISLFCFGVLFFSILASKFTTKLFLIFSLLLSSICAYFMDTYNVIIDSEMINNLSQTNKSEAFDLLSFNFFIYLIFLGILPSFLIFKIKISYGTIKQEIFKKIKFCFISSIILISIIACFSKFYSSFFREYKSLRYSANPYFIFYSTAKFTNQIFSKNLEFKEIANDAFIDKNSSKKLVIVVVGEAARSDKFSLNGYEKNTNPLLSKENILNFKNFFSCGTSTAVSVPCMFSVYKREDYSYKKGISTQNLVDILRKLNVKILWRDNNSDPKGVTTIYEDYKTNENNKICDIECRDEGMLVNLDDFIDKNKRENILIVLHQMGNHGPQYYKRYPKNFEKFTPVCKTSQLQKCSKESINNAYDNAILYTDYFLSKTINFLKKYEKSFQTSLFYLSDHGESLGENNIYLHGFPYFIAPKEQIFIPAFLWLGDNKNLNILREKLSTKHLSQDYFFHTMLGLFEVKTKIYDKNLDILNLQD